MRGTFFKSRGKLLMLYAIILYVGFIIGYDYAIITAK